MKKKCLLLFIAIFCILGFQDLKAADIQGKVTLQNRQELLMEGQVILTPISKELKRYVTQVDKSGTFFYKDLPAGHYEVKMDLHGLTKLKKVVEIKDPDESLVLEEQVITLSTLDKVLIFTVKASDFMWFPLMVLLLLGTGILLTVLCRFVQVRRLFLSLKMVVLGARHKDSTDKEEGDISPYAALMTALAATVGNGNIAGVATAIATGGPGAPVWMWIAGFFGMATKYAEGFLGVKFREKNKKGEMSGGPMYYARNGIKNRHLSKFLGLFFAVCGAIACLFGTGNMAQSNSMALVFNDQFNVPFWLTGLVITTVVGMVVLGGIKRIGSVSERLVPTMIILYFTGSLVIIFANITNLPHALSVIFKSAFSVKALGGGLIGASIKDAIALGVRRGLVSNESGLGSAAIAQSASKSSDPSKNGLIAMTGTFIDTIVVNTLTTLSIVITGLYLMTPAFRAAEQYTSTQLTAKAFDSVIPFGGYIIAISSLLFGYSTLLGWCYYGEKCLEYIFGVRIVIPFRIVFLILLFIGSNIQGEHLNIIWNVGDMANAFMALPNLITLLILSGLVGKVTNDYFFKKKKSPL